MLNLLKYELKKRKSTLIVGAIALIALEALTLYNLSKDKVILAMILSVLMVVGAVLIAFLDTAVQYFNDFKKAQGTLLFLTPNKGSKIVGSKMIFGALELLAGMVIVVLSIYVSNRYAVSMGYEGIGPQITSVIAELELSFGAGSTWWIATGFLIIVFLQYASSQSVAILSVTLGRTILSRSSYNWLWAVIIFIGTSFAIQTVNSVILLSIGLGDGWLQEIMMNGDVVNSTLDVTKFLIIGAIEYAAWIAVAFFASSIMLNKKIDI